MSAGRDDARRGAAPWGLVGMLALVVLGEWTFTRHEMDVIAPWHWDWRNTGKAARSEAPKAEVLCFGDSLVKFGVLPAVVEGRTGLKTYNLAVAVGQPPSSYFLLRRALTAGARPSALLVDATPHLLRASPRAPHHLRQWPELLGPSEMLDLAWTARDPDFFAAMAAAKLLPSLRARQEIRAAVLDALRGDASRRRFLAAQFWRNTRVNRGANAMSGSATNVDFAAVCRTLYSRFGCDPVNAAYLDRFLALAAERGIPVFWVVTPLSTELQQLCERSGFDAAHTAFLEDLRRRFPTLTVLDGRCSRYGQAVHTDDPVHLNHVGASAFTSDLAPFLARSLAGGDVPRWVALPPYRARPESIPIEDVNESGLALRKTAVRR